MTRAELLAANEALLARRKHEGVGQPKPIEGLVEAVANRDGMTLEGYLNALEQNLPTGNKKHEMDTCRAKWESFNSDRHPKLKKGVKTIKEWYNERLDMGGAIILAGHYGCGKSHLSQAVYDLYGYGAVYWNEIRLVERLQAGYGGNGSGRSLESIATECRRAKLLIFDDLGAYETDNLKWVQNIYLALLDGRHEDGKATFITTNLKMIETAQDGLVWQPLKARVGGRVYSRLMGQVGELSYYVDLFDVPDYRLRNF